MRAEHLQAQATLRQAEAMRAEHLHALAAQRLAVVMRAEHLQAPAAQRLAVVMRAEHLQALAAQLRLVVTHRGLQPGQLREASPRRSPSHGFSVQRAEYHFALMHRRAGSASHPVA